MKIKISVGCPLTLSHQTSWFMKETCSQAVWFVTLPSFLILLYGIRLTSSQIWQPREPVWNLLHLLVLWFTGHVLCYETLPISANFFRKSRLSNVFHVGFQANYNNIIMYTHKKCMERIQNLVDLIIQFTRYP